MSKEENLSSSTNCRLELWTGIFIELVVLELSRLLIQQRRKYVKIAIWMELRAMALPIDVNTRCFHIVNNDVIGDHKARSRPGPENPRTALERTSSRVELYPAKQSIEPPCQQQSKLSHGT
ncbi:hypothetical protein SELMODRAFT_410933 [Selaginella moellendorffii]|uniref:Uncharacterized protein n=1 Tax=Selaginella moellendorffii TaxID=88036 RepID=D8RGB9_SELML|nr:hypothetical protein SELMODRAFT_410933 [Selaginella moellendorffii]